MVLLAGIAVDSPHSPRNKITPAAGLRLLANHPNVRILPQKVPFPANPDYTSNNSTRVCSS
jgi:hypothetical protein